jgi:putative membrane protein
MGWQLHLDVLLVLGLVEGGYLYGLRAVGDPHGRQATRGQVAWFTAGVAALYLGAGTPVHELAEQRLLSAHMVQHALFTLVAPLLLLGTPGWLLRPLLDVRGVDRVARVLTAPLVTLALFNTVLLVTHLPPSVDAALRHHTLHFVVHIVLVLSALLLWWPVLSPLPELPRLSPLVQLAYLFVQSFVPTVLAAFMTFSQRVLYDFYAAAPRTWGLSALDDQVLAGLIMKLGGSAILWLAMGLVFFAWVRREEPAAIGGAPIDAPPRWEDVAAELEHMRLLNAREPPERG